MPASRLGMVAGVIHFTLPWPHKDLSPNARVHWRTRAKHTRSARADAFWSVAVALGKNSRPTWPKVAVHMAFAPPDRIRRDAHNLAASMKGAIDGIADALGIDDSRFLVSHELLNDIAGEVRVTLREAT